MKLWDLYSYRDLFRIFRYCISLYDSRWDTSRCRYNIRAILYCIVAHLVRSLGFAEYRNASRFVTGTSYRWISSPVFFFFFFKFDEYIIFLISDTIISTYNFLKLGLKLELGLGLEHPFETFSGFGYIALIIFYFIFLFLYAAWGYDNYREIGF